MPFDEALAERVRGVIGARDGVTERRMFGAVAWMLHGNMACGVIREDLLVRLGPEDTERALAEPHTKPFDMGPRVARGMILVDQAALGADAELASWIDAGAAYAATLPPK
jgi:TfoX/Sxy family transcriptional regulator of competence genes